MAIHSSNSPEPGVPGAPRNEPQGEARTNRASLDGERLRVCELNTDLPFAAQSNARDSRLRRWWRNFNLLLAGMYTGLTCYGTPHSQRPGDPGQDSNSQADKPDNRPI